MISGEKETGTLKLVLSNPAKRSTVLAAKYLGGFGVLIIPLAVSFLVGLILLLLEGFPLFAGGNLGRRPGHARSLGSLPFRRCSAWGS